MRYENWKMVFCEQKVQGTLEIWAAPFVCRRLPKMFNLRLDPYERADITSNTYYDWTIQRAFPDRAGSSARCAVRRDIQGLPAAAEAVELQRR
jgi:hypothetical protein